MNYKERADELEDKARKDAGRKLRVFHDAVQLLWSEANAIPGGCGGTPFRSDARAAEAKLRKCVTEFRERFGQAAVDKLRLHYGVD